MKKIVNLTDNLIGQNNPQVQNLQILLWMH